MDVVKVLQLKRPTMTENIEIWKVFYKSLLWASSVWRHRLQSNIPIISKHVVFIVHIQKQFTRNYFLINFFYLLEFPPFQHQILSSNLINVAATMAMFDHEFYVRVSALKCLGVASKISPLWEHLKQEHQDIQV